MTAKNLSIIVLIIPSGAIVKHEITGVFFYARACLFEYFVMSS